MVAAISIMRRHATFIEMSNQRSAARLGYALGADVGTHRNSFLSKDGDDNTNRDAFRIRIIISKDLSRSRVTIKSLTTLVVTGAANRRIVAKQPSTLYRA
jgi:hypothetical protein